MINKKLLSDIENYCKLNSIEVEEFVNRLLRDSFMVEKYGNVPKIHESLREGKRISNQKPPAKTPKPIIKPAPQKPVEENKIQNKEKDLYGE